MISRSSSRIGTPPRPEPRNVGSKVDAALEMGKKRIDAGVVPPLLDLLAGVPCGGAIAVEEPAGRGERQAEMGVGKIHRDLPGKGDIGRTAPIRSQVVRS